MSHAVSSVFFDGVVSRAACQSQRALGSCVGERHAVARSLRNAAVPPSPLAGEGRERSERGEGLRSRVWHCLPLTRFSHSLDHPLPQGERVAPPMPRNASTISAAAKRRQPCCLARRGRAGISPLAPSVRGDAERHEAPGRVGVVVDAGCLMTRDTAPCALRGGISGGVSSAATLGRASRNGIAASLKQAPCSPVIVPDGRSPGPPGDVAATTLAGLHPVPLQDRLMTASPPRRATPPMPDECGRKMMID